MDKENLEQEEKQIMTFLDEEGNKVEFEAIAIVAGSEGGNLMFTAPCGVCRQVMMEFCEYETFRIIIGTGEDEYQEFTLKEILPYGFGPNNLA